MMGVMTSETREISFENCGQVIGMCKNGKSYCDIAKVVHALFSGIFMKKNYGKTPKIENELRKRKD